MKLATYIFLSPNNEPGFPQIAPLGNLFMSILLLRHFCRALSTGKGMQSEKGAIVCACVCSFSMPIKPNPNCQGDNPKR